MRLEIVNEREGAVPVLRLLGTLDVSTVDQLRERTMAVLEEEAPAVGVDLAQVTFVDSSGLGALLSGKKRGLEKGKQYYLLDCPAPLQSLLALVGLDQVMDFCTRRELAEKFPAPPPPPARPAAGQRK